MQTIPPSRDVPGELHNSGFFPALKCRTILKMSFRDIGVTHSSTRQQLLLDPHFFQRDEFRQAAFGR
jgi:hypothetical protein